MKVRDMVRMIESDGWYHVGTEGDHRHFKHTTKTGKVTIAGKLSDDIPVPTLKRIFQQAQLPFRRK